MKGIKEALKASDEQQKKKLHSWEKSSMCNGDDQKMGKWRQEGNFSINAR
jgi:hypothetical protein